MLLIFDVSARLTSRLLGISFVLTARGIAFVVSGAARLLRIPCALAGILADITRSLALLTLLRRPRHSWQTRKEHRSHQGGEERLES
jgi:membrane protein implicated in regulation of membrane protease activity